MHRNQFTGSIPQSFGQLKNMMFLSFGDNIFTGTLPDSFAQLTKLGILFFLSPMNLWLCIFSPTFLFLTLFCILSKIIKTFYLRPGLKLMTHWLRYVRRTTPLRDILLPIAQITCNVPQGAAKSVVTMFFFMTFVTMGKYMLIHL